MLKWIKNKIIWNRQRKEQKLFYQKLNSKAKQQSRIKRNATFNFNDGDLVIKAEVEYRIRGVHSYAKTCLQDIIIFSRLDEFLNSTKIYSFSLTSGLEKVLLETPENDGFMEVVQSADQRAIVQSFARHRNLSFEIRDTDSVIKIFDKSYIYKLDSFAGKYYLIGPKEIQCCPHGKTEALSTIFKDAAGGINDCLFLDNHIVVTSFILPKTTITIIPSDGSQSISFTEIGMVKLLNSLKSASKFQYTISTPFMPEVFHEVDCVRPSSSSTTCIPNQYKFSFMKTSVDRIPYTLFHMSKLRLNGTNPAHVISYGAYGEILNPFEYRPEILCLVDLGFVVCFAHIRGGGELGFDWYQEGTREKKIQSISDLDRICTELATSDLVDPKRVSISTFSAGGLIVAALMNRRPNFFTAAILDSPFLNPYSLLVDPEAKSTKLEKEELGSDLDLIKGYDPMINLVSSSTSLLILGGIHDDRVDLKHLIEFDEARRDLSPNSRTELILIDRGHFARDTAYENSLKLAFLAVELDVYAQ